MRCAGGLRGEPWKSPRPGEAFRLSALPKRFWLVSLLTEADFAGIGGESRRASRSFDFFEGRVKEGDRDREGERDALRFRSDT